MMFILKRRKNKNKLPYLEFNQPWTYITKYGTRITQCYANIFMAKLEKNFLSSYPYKPLAYYRYIDDIYIIWSHGLDLLHDFINSINKQHNNIIYTSNISTTSVNFLDVTIDLDGGHISTKIYTDNHAFFHTVVSSLDISGNLLSIVNFYVTNAFVLMTKCFSTMPPKFFNTF